MLRGYIGIFYCWVHVFYIRAPEATEGYKTQLWSLVGGRGQEFMHDSVEMVSGDGAGHLQLGWISIEHGSAYRGGESWFPSVRVGLAYSLFRI